MRSDVTKIPAKVAVISDTHGEDFADRIAKIKPDILIHCGDWSGHGRMDEFMSFINELKQCQDAGVEYIIACPGNHDRVVEKMTTYCKDAFKRYLGPNAHLLVGDMVNVLGYEFYGNPYCPRFFDWSFYEDDDTPDMERRWSVIPEGVDVLVSHGPPHKMLDYVPDRRSAGGVNAGGVTHLNHLVRLSEAGLLLNCFGHIHSGYGHMRFRDTLMVNGAFLNNNYDWGCPNPVYVVDLTPERADIHFEGEENVIDS